MHRQLIDLKKGGSAVSDNHEMVGMSPADRNRRDAVTALSAQLDKIEAQLDTVGKLQGSSKLNRDEKSLAQQVAGGVSGVLSELRKDCTATGYANMVRVVESWRQRSAQELGQVKDLVNRQGRLDVSQVAVLIGDVEEVITVAQRY